MNGAAAAQPVAARSWETALFVGILALGAFLRLETLGLRPLWADEIFVWNVSSGAGLADVWRGASVDHAANPPLHLLIAHIALRVSESVTALRLPSVLFGLLALGLVVALGARLFDRRTGLIAGLLMALSVYQINYAQDARPYPLLLALTTAQYLSFVLYLERPRAAPLVAFTLLGTASLYTHHLGLVTQAATGMSAIVWWWLSARPTRRPRHSIQGASDESHDAQHEDFTLKRLSWLALAYGVMLLIYLPQLIHVVQYLSSPLLDAKYLLTPSLRLFHELFARWGAGRGPISLAYDAAFLLGLVFLLANLLRGLRGGSRESFQQRERCELAALVSLACFAAPFLLFSLVPFSKFFDIRFLMQAYPAFVMVAAHGLVRSSDLFGDRVHVRWLRATSRGRIASAMLLILVTGIAVPNLTAYAAFRQTRYRCSDYFRAPRLLSAYDGFCVRHILLSTNIATDKFLVRSLDGPSRGRLSPVSVPRVGGPQRRSSD